MPPIPPIWSRNLPVQVPQNHAGLGAGSEEGGRGKAGWGPAAHAHLCPPPMTACARRRAGSGEGGGRQAGVPPTCARRPHPPVPTGVCRGAAVHAVLRHQAADGEGPHRRHHRRGTLLAERGQAHPAADRLQDPGEEAGSLAGQRGPPASEPRPSLWPPSQPEGLAARPGDRLGDSPGPAQGPKDGHASLGSSSHLIVWTQRAPIASVYPRLPSIGLGEVGMMEKKSADF